MKALYLMFMFYPTLAEVQKEVRDVKAEAELLSGGDYRVLAFGGNSCVIGFMTDVEYRQIRERMARIKGEHYQWLLTPGNRAMSGYMWGTSWEWFAARLPKE